MLCWLGITGAMVGGVAAGVSKTSGGAIGVVVMGRAFDVCILVMHGCVWAVGDAKEGESDRKNGEQAGKAARRAAICWQVVLSRVSPGR